MKIQLKRSNQLDGGFAKEPTVAQMEYGELAVNYESSDPTIFYKDSANTIRSLKLAAVPDLTNVTNQSGTLDERYLNIAGGLINGDLQADSFIGGVCRISSTPPLSAVPGELWYNTDDGRTYVYFTDINGDSQWVDQSPDTFSLTENFYNKSQSDARYLQIAGGTVTGYLTLESGAQIDNELEVGVDALNYDNGVRLSPQSNLGKNGLVEIYCDQSAVNNSERVFEVKNGDAGGNATIIFTADGGATFDDLVTVQNLNVLNQFTADDANLLDGQAGSYYLDYNNLINTPTVITNNNQLTNGAGYVTAATAPVTSVNGQTGDITINGTTNLGKTTATDQITITSSTGTDVTIGEATGSIAGLMSTTHHDKLDGIEAGATADQTGAEIKSAYESQSDTNAFTDAEKTKLSGIASGAQVNVATNLGKTTATNQITITSSTGNDVTIGEATGSIAGLMSTTHHNKLDGIASGAEVNVGTNLSYTAGTRVLASSTGSNVTLPTASTSTPGLFSNTDKSKLDGIEAGANNITNNNQLTNGAGYVTSTGNVSYATASGNADTVDQIHGYQFLRSDVDDTADGAITFNGVVSIRNALDLADNDVLRFGTGDDCELFCNGSHMYMDLNAGIGNFYIRDGSTTRFTFDDAGAFTATGDITAFSDIRLKDDIEVIPDALDKISKIRGVTFTRNDLGGNPRQAGVIAQEVEKVLPEVVRHDVQGTKSVAYGNLVGLLIEAIKELKAEVESLKTGGY